MNAQWFIAMGVYRGELKHHNHNNSAYPNIITYSTQTAHGTRFSITQFIAVLCAFTQRLLFDKVIVCSGVNSEATTTPIQHPLGVVLKGWIIKLTYK